MTNLPAPSIQIPEVFERIDLHQALPGDLVVHVKGELVSSNHIGIFTRNESGTVFEISALKRNGDATKSIDDPAFRTSVVEHPVQWIGNDPMILRWKIK